MRTAVAQLWLRVRYSGRAIARSAANATTFLATRLFGEIGFRETLLLGGSALIGVALVPIYPPAAYGVPGAIFVYVAIFGVN